MQRGSPEAHVVALQSKSIAFPFALLILRPFKSQRLRHFHHAPDHLLVYPWISVAPFVFDSINTLFHIHLT